jgi:hypothetical protein
LKTASTAARAAERSARRGHWRQCNRERCAARPTSQSSYGAVSGGSVETSGIAAEQHVDLDHVRGSRSDHRRLPAATIAMPAKIHGTHHPPPGSSAVNVASEADKSNTISQPNRIQDSCLDVTPSFCRRRLGGRQAADEGTQLARVSHRPRPATRSRQTRLPASAGAPHPGKSSAARRLS